MPSKQELALTDQQAEDRRWIAQIREVTGHDVVRIALVRTKMATSAGRKPEDVPMKDVLLFMMVEKELGLDSLLNQIHWIVRGGKASHQVGIDGFRAIADRSGVYAGSEAPVFRGALEYPFGVVPESASVVVRKLVDGHVVSFVGLVFWTEFYPGDDDRGFMYRRMPKHMLAKDAESQALRKAFPAQLGGVEYSPTIEPTTTITEAPQRDNAQEYDRIFGAEDSLPREAGQDGRAPSEEEGLAAGNAQEPSAGASPSAWDENRRLSTNAEALGLRIHVLRNDTPLEQVEAYNVELAEQIAQRQLARR